MLRVLQPMFKPVINQICCKTGFTWVVKRATPLFHSFCSNVAKQVTCFLLPFFRILTHFDVVVQILFDVLTKTSVIYQC